MTAETIRSDRQSGPSPLPRQLAAEFLGTAALVAAVVGSGIMADALTPDTALALLANTIATGAILVVLISAFGAISGAHFNPAVSMVFALRRDISWQTALAYAATQIAGGIAGAWMAHAMFDLPILQFSTTTRTGAGQWLSEGVATFGLIAVILAGVKFERKAVPMMVGLYISAAYWFTASTSFANPAVTIARSLTDSFSGIRAQDVLGFIPAQMAGALAAATLMAWLLASPTQNAPLTNREDVP